MNRLQLSLILFLLFLSYKVDAQPQWENLVAYYHYTILDENGEEISFKNNPDYRIIVGDVLYQAPNIPSDSLKENEKLGGSYMNDGYENQFKINDFSLAIVQEENFDNRTNQEIKIIHKQDTMHFFQPSEWHYPEGLINGKLKFLPGHYYFPKWAYKLQNGLPKNNPEVHFKNYHQSNYIIPKSYYDAIMAKNNEEEREIEYRKLEKLVFNNFTKGHFTLTSTREVTKMSQSIAPYEYEYIEGLFYSSKNDPDIYYGEVNAGLISEKCWRSMLILAALDVKKNTLNMFLPTSTSQLSGRTHALLDEFNNRLYLFAPILDNYDPDLPACLQKGTATTHVYHSDDGGRTWTEDAQANELVKTYSIGSIHFLDKDYQIGIFHNEANHGSQNRQSTFYLLKNMEVIDSLVLPDNVYFNNNKKDYYYKQEKDTTFLGVWNFDMNEEENENMYYLPYITLVDGDYQLHHKKITEEYLDETYQTEPTEDAISYHNFQLIDERQLVFTNGAATLNSNKKISQLRMENLNDVEPITPLLEFESEIYLIDDFLYFSMDAGASWFIYPGEIMDHPRGMKLLEIKKSGEITFFDSVHDENLSKVVYSIMAE